MNEDHCTWDEDYKQVTRFIRSELLSIGHVTEDKYTTVLMQGSGSFGVEAVLTTAIGPEDKVLFLINGVYGSRMVKMAETAGLNYQVISFKNNENPDGQSLIKALEEDPSITHVAMVHCETTTGIINPIEEISQIVKSKGLTFILDAMSSFGGIDIDMEKLSIDYLVSSANKCIEGVPGFSFAICNREKLEKTEGNCRSHSLDLYDQWKVMEVDGKWRFTSPTHVVLAFAQALKELEEEGGVKARNQRYSHNSQLLVDLLEPLGFTAYIEKESRSPIITSYLYPKQAGFDFDSMYNYVKDRGFVIYPGKLTDVDTFRIGNIGQIFTEDIEELGQIFKSFIEEQVN